MNSATLLWFRQDLRLADNPALRSAVEHGGAVVPVFIWSPEEEASWPPGSTSRWWLHQSLAALDTQLRAVGSRLIIRSGPTLDTLRLLVKETNASNIVWNRRYEPASTARDKLVKEALRAEGIATESFNAALLHEPWTIQNQSGAPFKVFTPFWRHCLVKSDPVEPLHVPTQVASPARWPESLALTELQLEANLKWTDGLRAVWQPGETGAASNLKRFLAKAFDDYAAQRDRPDVVGTSRLSPHLHFGEIGPRQVWHELKVMAANRGLAEEQWRGSQFTVELGWREFAYHLLYHFPHTPTEPLRADFKRFSWRRDEARLHAWEKGLTGYPIVDAGLRELQSTGWIHNRVRMIVASFLVKDLLVPWQEGARWFWEQLVDADLANNTLGWQWTAGCGADASPFFRIFNPTTQGKKFDPNGDYVRRWCPELTRLPTEWIHRPSEAPPEILRAAGVDIGSTYPEPIVNHAIARAVALETFARLQSARA